jgi:hypothetical protein
MKAGCVLPLRGRLVKGCSRLTGFACVMCGKSSCFVLVASEYTVIYKHTRSLTHSLTHLYRTHTHAHICELIYTYVEPEDDGVQTPKKMFESTDDWKESCAVFVAESADADRCGEGTCFQCMYELQTDGNIGTETKFHAHQTLTGVSKSHRRLMLLLLKTDNRKSFNERRS